MSSPGVSKLISRSEFRAVLKSVIRCLRGELNAPGLAPLTAEEIHFWFQNITLEDIEAVNKETDAGAPAEHPSRVQSMLQKIREKMRGGEGTVDESPARTSLGKDPEGDSEDKPNE
jgi:hypothetical protein